MTLPAFPLQNRSVPLEAVHLIVHPGYGLKYRSSDAEQRLLDSIGTRAVALDTRCELALVLLHARNVRRPVQSLMEHMRHAIAGNLVIVHASGPDVNVKGLGRIFESAHREIMQRGFSVMPETVALAYGETAKICVPNAAASFAGHFTLKHRPQVDVGLTDALICASPEDWMEGGYLLEQMRKTRTELAFIPLRRQQI